MPAGDPVLRRELQALQDDVSTSQKQRRARRKPAAPEADEPAAPASAAAAVTTGPDGSADAQDLRRELRELLDEATAFFADAEKNMAAHPAATALGALVVGILIGRLLGRR